MWIGDGGHGQGFKRCGGVCAVGDRSERARIPKPESDPPKSPQTLSQRTRIFQTQSRRRRHSRHKTRHIRLELDRQTRCSHTIELGFVNTSYELSKGFHTVGGIDKYSVHSRSIHGSLTIINYFGNVRSVLDNNSGGFTSVCFPPGPRSNKRWRASICDNKMTSINRMTPRYRKP